MGLTSGILGGGYQCYHFFMRAFEKLGIRASVVDRLHSVTIVSWPAAI